MVDAQPLHRPSRQRAALWVLVVLLAVVAGALLVELGASPSQAQTALPAGGGSNVLLVAGQIFADSYGCYILDTQKSTICVYQWVSAPKRMPILKFVAARNYTFDLKLEDYNTELTPREVRKMVEQLGAETRPTDRHGS